MSLTLPRAVPAVTRWDGSEARVHLCYLATLLRDTERPVGLQALPQSIAYDNESGILVQVSPTFVVLSITALAFNCTMRLCPHPWVSV